MSLLLARRLVSLAEQGAESHRDFTATVGRLTEVIDELTRTVEVLQSRVDSLEREGTALVD